MTPAARQAQAMEFNAWEQERIRIMRKIALEMSGSAPAVLKGGTSLLLVRGLTRFSEDLDFDLPPGTIVGVNVDLRSTIEKAMQSLSIAVAHIYEKKDSETTMRYSLHYKSAVSGDVSILKIEFSMRNAIKPEDVEIVDGLKVYRIARLADLKTDAFIARDKGRDTYDVVFLLEKYYPEIAQTTLKRIFDNVENKSINWLSNLFDDESQEDPLLARFDGTEIVGRLAYFYDQYKERQSGSLVASK